MEKVSLLVDTDIFIDYFNTGRFDTILENRLFVTYYSSVSEKELLSKKGLSSSEQEAIRYALKRYRRININNSIASVYSRLRNEHPTIDKEDALIAATAITKKLPLVTRNYKHYRKIKELALFTGKG
jgi:hypothetical protein